MVWTRVHSNHYLACTEMFDHVTDQRAECKRRPWYLFLTCTGEYSWWFYEFIDRSVITFQKVSWKRWIKGKKECWKHLRKNIWNSGNWVRQVMWAVLPTVSNTQGLILPKFSWWAFPPKLMEDQTSLFGEIRSLFRVQTNKCLYPT